MYDTIDKVGDLLESTEMETILEIPDVCPVPAKNMSWKMGTSEIYEHKDILQDLIVSTIAFFIWIIIYLIYHVTDVNDYNKDHSW